MDRFSVVVSTLAVGCGWPLVGGLARNGCGGRTTGCTERTTGEGADGRTLAAARDGTHCGACACAQQPAAECALSRIIGVCAGGQSKAGYQDQA